jgi:hypothetical protein
MNKIHGNKEKKRQGKLKKEEVDSHAAHVGNDNASIASNVGSLGAMDSMSTTLAPCCQNAVNDDRTVSTVTDAMFAQLCLDLNNMVNHLGTLLAKFKAAHAVKVTAETNNGTYVYDAFTSMTTHDHHDLSFHSMQEINTTVYDNIVGLYVQYSDDIYSNKVQNINNELSKALQLHATCHAIVQTINCLLRVLFYSGANKMMMKHFALPPGVNPLLGRKCCVTSVTSSALLDKEVLIEDLFFPEFSSTTRISGPIHAIIMDNVESSYELIIGMDLMQTLGIEIYNSSKQSCGTNYKCCLSHTITSQATCLTQLCKTRWLVCLMITMLMKR